MNSQATPPRARKAKKPEYQGTATFHRESGEAITVAVRNGVSEPIYGPFRQGEVVTVVADVRLSGDEGKEA